MICLCATTILHAQDAKTLEAKTVEMQRTNIPSPVPEFKPQPETTSPAAEKVAKPTEAATKKEEQKLPPGKMELKTFNEADIITPGGEEAKKILAGNKTNAPATSMMPSSATPPVAPPVIKAPVSKQQQ